MSGSTMCSTCSTSTRWCAHTHTLASPHRARSRPGLSPGHHRNTPTPTLVSWRLTGLVCAFRAGQHRAPDARVHALALPVSLATRIIARTCGASASASPLHLHRISPSLGIGLGLHQHRRSVHAGWSVYQRLSERFFKISSDRHSLTNRFHGSG